MTLSKRLRYEVLRRDAFTCRYCGRSSPEVRLTVDHVTPIALGGVDDPSNLVACCSDCNAGKSSSSPEAATVADVASDALRWSRALRAVVEGRAEHRAAVTALTAEFDALWRTWTFVETGDVVDRPPNWRSSIEQFYALGMDLESMRFELVPVMTNPTVYDPWRCFCSRCWKYITSIRDETLEVIRLGESLKASWEDR